MKSKEEMRQLLKIAPDRLEAINQLLLDSSLPGINEFLDVVGKYGTPEEINAKAIQARKLENLLNQLEKINHSYFKDLLWLQEKRDAKEFITLEDFRRKVLGEQAEKMRFREDCAVTLEISACQYFPWVIEEARQALEKRELMPGRFIRVRRMKESEEDNGDLLAFAASMEIMGASYVETLDTKGTDGSNIHLGGPETITGYFGGVGQPNDHPLLWVDELLYYYTKYGVPQVLNLNSGTILLAFLLYRIGIDIQFKISVYTGHDNPYSALWTMMMAKLFSRDDGSSPLIGLNWSNSVNEKTLEIASQLRKVLGFEKIIRFEHHITEAWKSIVIQPYNRREELIRLADHVPNISAKHEGGEVEVEQTRQHPSDILDYFRAKEEIEEKNEMPLLLQNYLDKHESVNLTAKALTEHGLSFIAAPLLHR